MAVADSLAPTKAALPAEPAGELVCARAGCGPTRPRAAATVAAANAFVNRLVISLLPSPLGTGKTRRDR